jgi:hypothetical protein
MLRTLLPLALIATAGTAYAQTMSAPAPTPSTPAQTMSTPATPAQPMSPPSQTMSTGTMSTGQATPGSVDANGQPIIGRNDWVRQPGDRQQGSGTQSRNMDPNMAAAPAPARARMSGAGQPGPDGTFRDEYGFRYDAQGNRIDARGRIMPPPVSRQ